MGQFESIWLVTAMEGRKRGRDCPEPVGVEVFKIGPYPRASLVEYVAILWTVTVVHSLSAVLLGMVRTEWQTTEVDSSVEVSTEVRNSFCHDG